LVEFGIACFESSDVFVGGIESFVDGTWDISLTLNLLVIEWFFRSKGCSTGAAAANT
jgi:hypothetical protein